jgi:dipeptidyl aminopeptidase/acylaminoacyl peptidase
MNLAQHAWDAGGADRVRELLEKHRPKAGETDLRRFEWYYLYRLCHADLLTLNTGGWVHSVAYSPDGKRLASAGTEAVKVWDAQTGQELLSLKGGTLAGDWSNCVAFSPDGKRLAISRNVRPGGVGEVKVLDAQTGQELLSLMGHTAGVSSVVFSPDGKRLASGSGNTTGSQDGEVKVWDAQTGQELLTLKGGSTIIDGRSRSPIELTGNGTVFVHRTQAIRTEKGPPVLRPRIIPTPSPSIFVIKPISIVEERQAGWTWERIYLDLSRRGERTRAGREWSVSRIRRAYAAEVAGKTREPLPKRPRKRRPKPNLAAEWLHRLVRALR